MIYNDTFSSVTIIKKMISEDRFYIKRVIDDTVVKVYDFQSEYRRFIIADDEGFSKAVTAYIEGSRCGEDTEYVIPIEVSEYYQNELAMVTYHIDADILNEHRDVILGLDPSKKDFKVGDFVVYGDSRYYDEECREYRLPPLGSLILVSAITKAHTGEPVVTGYTTVKGQIIRVNGEAWRFTKSYIGQKDQSLG